MKKILLSLLLAFVCVQVYSAQDLQLSLSDDNVFTGGNSFFDPATGVITLGDNYSPGVGWDFSGSLSLPSKDEYSAVKFVFAEPITMNMLEIKIQYANQDPAVGDFYIGVPQGVTSFIIPLTDDVMKIYFQSSNWQNFPSATDTLADGSLKYPDGIVPIEDYPTLTLKSATFVAIVPTEKEDITPTDDQASAWGDMNFYAATKSITINALNWDPGIVWTFDPPKSNEEYVGVGFTFAQPVPAVYNFNLNVHYPATFEHDAITTGINVPAGSTSITYNFAEPVDQISFVNQDWQGYNVYPTNIYFDEMYLIKKAGAGLKKINVNTGPVDVYTILGVKVRSQVERANALKGLQKGIYIVGGQKVLVTTAP